MQITETKKNFIFAFCPKITNSYHHYTATSLEKVISRSRQSSETHHRVWSPGRSYLETSPFCRWACPPTILPPPGVSQGSLHLYWMTAHPHCSAWSWSEPLPSAAHLHRSQTFPVEKGRHSPKARHPNASAGFDYTFQVPDKWLVCFQTIQLLFQNLS